MKYGISVIQNKKKVMLNARDGGYNVDVCMYVCVYAVCVHRNTCMAHVHSWPLDSSPYTRIG